jgi:hypothetical protein
LLRFAESKFLERQEKMATGGQVAVIVAQDGTEAAQPLESLIHGASTVVLLSQEPGESLSQLSQRVRARVALLLKDGFKVQSATFVARNGFGLTDVPATAEMLRILVSTMVAQYGSRAEGRASTGHGKVFLHAHSRDTRAHYALAALTDAISDQVRGTGVDIIHGAPRQHGLYAPALAAKALEAAV